LSEGDFNIMPESVCLESSRLWLRQGQTDDIPAILRYYGDNRDFLAPFEPRKSEVFYTEQHWHQVLQQNLLDAQADRSLKLFLFLKQAPETVLETAPLNLMGSLNFSNFTRGVFQNCTVGYSLAERYQGQGYMSEALSTGIAHIFSKLQFHRIEANYLPHNQRSGRLLKRLGFIVNGYARDYICIDGRWQDHILTSLLNSAWLPNDERR
jgi:[ribosomal protein S5]-alanine N-acetyltransferase